MNLRDIRFGIEIETVGRDRQRVAEVIQTVVGGELGTPSGHHGVTAADGRVWKCVWDGSINGIHAEIVSPILKYEDIPTLQQIARAVKRCGADVDEQCGIHVHTDAAAFGVTGTCSRTRGGGHTALARLVKIVNKQQDLIAAALGIDSNRLRRYAQPVRPELLRMIESRRIRSLDDLNRAWYAYQGMNRAVTRSPQHYDGTRYAGCNLHNIWYRGTAEFRWFDSTLHAGKIKAYVQFCLALSAHAITARAASSRARPFNPETAKYDFRCFLLRLGLIGDEFKTARLHLLKNLGGSSAWRNTRPAPRLSQAELNAAAEAEAIRAREAEAEDRASFRAETERLSQSDEAYAERERERAAAFQAEAARVVEQDAAEAEAAALPATVAEVDLEARELNGEYGALPNSDIASRQRRQENRDRYGALQTHRRALLRTESAAERAAA